MGFSVPITVLYFAAAREAAGVGSESLPPLPDVGQLRRALADRHPALAPILSRCRIAVDQSFGGDDAPIRDGAEVAVIPPVSGGAGLFRVIEEPIDEAQVSAAVASPGRGAVVTFRGDVRAETGGRRVVRLEYEAYRPMAEGALARIGRDLEVEHGASVAVVHRVGHLAPGDAAVVIACAAPHRTAAFRACEAAIERLKKEVPIWKREVFEDGSIWVGMGP
jgi:molybdopterin synthase catalytic subunit